MNPIDELNLFLRPAGAGVYLVSSGRSAQLELQKKIYGVESDAEVILAHAAAVQKIRSARAIILGVPSDVGAGFLRGANMGPQGVRERLLEEEPSFFANMAERGVVDIGDVIVVPQLLHDSMLSEEQLSATRAELYPLLNPEERRELPASPLSITEKALDLIFQINPSVIPFVIGGDHSIAWAVSSALARRKSEALGIVQIDAHTDLLETRLGVKYCFATWSFHASKLLGDRSRMVQVGVRATRFPREHWEKTVGVRQFWASECLSRGAAAIDDIVAHLKARGVKELYFSNDIDGTDSEFVDATGTPEPGGLAPDFVEELIKRLGAEFRIVAGDVMEVAPPIARTAGGAAKTLEVAAGYVRVTIGAALRSGP